MNGLNLCKTKEELQKNDLMYFKCVKDNIIYIQLYEKGNDKLLIPLYKILKIFNNPHKIFYLNIIEQLNDMSNFENMYSGVIDYNSSYCGKEYNYYICDLNINLSSRLGKFFMSWHRGQQI